MILLVVVVCKHTRKRWNNIARINATPQVILSLYNWIGSILQVTQQVPQHHIRTARLSPPPGATRSVVLQCPCTLLPGSTQTCVQVLTPANVVAPSSIGTLTRPGPFFVGWRHLARSVSPVSPLWRPFSIVCGGGVCCCSRRRRRLFFFSVLPPPPRRRRRRRRRRTSKKEGNQGRPCRHGPGKRLNFISQ